MTSNRHPTVACTAAILLGCGLAWTWTVTGCTFDSTLPEHLRERPQEAGPTDMMDLLPDLEPDGDAVVDWLEDGTQDPDAPPPIDADGDGLGDDQEILLGTNPYDADTDGDGLTDYQEVVEVGTDPVRSDSDEDGFSDGAEQAAGTDPLDPEDFPTEATCVDEDQDGYGTYCPAGPDCDDDETDINPAAADLCNNGVDEDCSGADLSCPASCVDEDRDGYGYGTACAGPDGCPFDPAKIEPGLCGCGTPDADGDLDTVPDCLDVCLTGNDQLDTDGDGIPNACDQCQSAQDTDVDGVPDDCDACPGWDDSADADGDLLPDLCDPCPQDNPNDTDGDRVCDSQDACPGGDDRVNTDADALPNACDTDDDNDGVPDVDDTSVINPDVCQDTDRDLCDDCAVGTDDLGPEPDYNPAADGTDTDGDVMCDLGDPDDDNDGVADGVDSAPFDPHRCQDSDDDLCDDCTLGTDAFGPAPDSRPNADGQDTDGDGLCDLGDDCTDVDGDGLGNGTLENAGCVDSTTDSDDENPSACADTDEDLCDDCVSETFAPAADGPDADEDGLCDLGDDCTDMDGDGLGDGSRENIGCIHTTTDSDDEDPSVCADTDEDQCDDCTSENFAPDDDGADADADGLCDLGDDCNDVDGDGLGNGNLGNAGCVVGMTDTDDTDPTECLDADDDSCDDCSSGTWDPALDGPDEDGDGRCSPGDNCPSVYNPDQSDTDWTGTYADGEPLAAIPVPSWADFARVSLGDDDLSSAIPIGFEFHFFDSTHTSAYICSNGFLSFDSDAPCDWDPTARSIPYGHEPNNLIALFWEDLDPSDGGWVGYKTVGAEGNRQFIVAFYDVPHWYGFGSEPVDVYPVTATMTLHESTGAIDLVCYSCPSNNDGRLRGEHTQGVENASGTAGWAPSDRNNAVFPTLTNDGIRVYTDLVNTGPDGVGDACDNCPTVHNPGQEDTRLTEPYAFRGPIDFWPRDMTDATEVVLADEQLSGAVPIGFPFEFYGTVYESAYICSNGFLSFDSNAACSQSASRLLPNSASPNNLVALYWEDLDPSHTGSGSITYLTRGERPDREFVVEFEEIRHWNSSVTISGQIVLRETSNDIEILCIDCQADCYIINPNSCPHTQGIENAQGTVHRAMTRRNHVSFELVDDAVLFHPDSYGDACDLDG